MTINIEQIKLDVEYGTLYKYLNKPYIKNDMNQSIVQSIIDLNNKNDLDWALPFTIINNMKTYFDLLLKNSLVDINNKIYDANYRDRTPLWYAYFRQKDIYYMERLLEEGSIIDSEIIYDVNNRYKSINYQGFAIEIDKIRLIQLYYKLQQ
jgi:phosphatidate phosphatase PAH1